MRRSQRRQIFSNHGHQNDLVPQDYQPEPGRAFLAPDAHRSYLPDLDYFLKSPAA